MTISYIKVDIDKMISQIFHIGGMVSMGARWLERDLAALISVPETRIVIRL